ncbi:MAG: MATE family efflux transporter [Planctomycetaceae bacterium]|nr:MATE family efflux transporter [Planctomycetaceae bacterium]
MENSEKFAAKLQRMTTEPVERLVVKMAIPTIIIMMISAFYNMADTYFVGSLGTTATAAVGVSFSFMALIQAIGFFFGHGAGNFISRQLGARNYDNAARMAVTGFASALVTGLVIALLGLLFIRPLAIGLGSTPTILPQAMQYLRFILMGAPWMAGSLALNNLLRFQGSAAYGMVGVTSGAILNVILDPIFIFGLDLGVAGASLATMVSQFVSFCLLFIGCTRGGNIAIRLRNFSLRLQDFREIVRGGLPSLCRQGLASIAVVTLNRLAGGYGDAAIAAMSVVMRVYWMASSALIGWGQGFQPVCGFNYGAGRFDRVKTAFRFCVKTATVVLVVLAAVGIIFAPDIIVRFRDDPEVVAIGSLALRFQCAVMPLSGWVIMNNMMLQTIGKAVPATILALARQGLFLMPLLVLLTPTLGVLGIQMAQPLADLLTFLLSLALGLRILKNMGAEGVPELPKSELEIEVGEDI